MATSVAVSACTDGRGDSSEPSARDIVSSSVEWIKQDDYQAVPSDDAPIKWWLFSDHGKALGLSGGLLIHESELLVRVRGGLPSAETDELIWVRVSSQDLVDGQMITDAEDLFRGWITSVMSQPLLVLESMTVEDSVSESKSGSSWVVRGGLRSDMVFESFMAPETLSAAVDTGLIPSVQLKVTLEVDKSSKRPLGTEISAQGSVIVRYSWVRGIWDVPEDEVIGADDFIRGR